MVLGVGERLFGESIQKTGLRLLYVETIGEGLPLLTYKVV